MNDVDNDLLSYQSIFSQTKSILRALLHRTCSSPVSNTNNLKKCASGIRTNFSLWCSLLKVLTFKAHHFATKMQCDTFFMLHEDLSFFCSTHVPNRSHTLNSFSGTSYLHKVENSSPRFPPDQRGVMSAGWEQPDGDACINDLYKPRLKIITKHTGYVTHSNAVFISTSRSTLSHQETHSV